MTRLARLTAAAGVALLAALVAPVTSKAASAGPAYSWGGISTWPTNRTVGTDAYQAGVWSYTDRWGDATGANLDGKHREDYFAGLPQAQTLTYDGFGSHRLPATATTSRRKTTPASPSCPPTSYSCSCTLRPRGWTCG